jgi:hypothetical protein
MIVTCPLLRVYPFSHVKVTIVHVRPLRVCVLRKPIELPASCLSTIISNGFKSNIYNIMLNLHL